MTLGIKKFQRKKSEYKKFSEKQYVDKESFSYLALMLLLFNFSYKNHSFLDQFFSLLKKKFYFTVHLIKLKF